MSTQVVFRAGNSQVVAIPKALAEEVGLSVGEKVMVTGVRDGDGILIQKVKPKAKKTVKNINNEFEKWLDQIMERDGEILDELALR